MSDPGIPFDYDVFLSHASEDKADFVRPLAEKLDGMGISVWYDEWTLGPGDRLRRKIDEGLKRSRFGVVVLSRAFFSKRWPQSELDGLAALEGDGVDRILPIWLDVTIDEVATFSPTLADRIAAQSTSGIDEVARQIKNALERTPNRTPTPEPLRRAQLKAAVDGRLDQRGLTPHENGGFVSGNANLATLSASAPGPGGSPPPYAALCLVPIGRSQELDGGQLFDWAADSVWAPFHPLDADEIRPRGDGILASKKGGRGGVSRYTYIAGDGYVELGRALGGWEEKTEIMIFRLGQLLWAAHGLCEFADDLAERFDLRAQFVLVVTVNQARGAYLAFLGEHWREPWDRLAGFYRPECKDVAVQFRTPLKPAQNDDDRLETVWALDLYLNRAWGVNEARGHDHPERGGKFSEKYRRQDPWE